MSLIATYGLIIFTDFVPNVEARFQCGWALIAITMTILVINMLTMISLTLKDTFRTIKLKKRKRKYLKVMERRKRDYEKYLYINRMVNERNKDPLRNP